MENPPFEDVFPIKDGDFSIAMFVYQRVAKPRSPGPKNKRLKPGRILEKDIKVNRTKMDFLFNFSRNHMSQKQKPT